MRVAGAHRKKRKEHLCDARALSQPASKPKQEPFEKKKQSVVRACVCVCASAARPNKQRKLLFCIILFMHRLFCMCARCLKCVNRLNCQALS